MYKGKIKDKIEWTNESWNPVSGCLNSCYYCYARAIYERQKWSFKPTLHPKRLDKPLKFKKPTMFFVCSVADLFGDWIDESWIKTVISIAEKCPEHTFQFLTKNPKRLLEFSPYPFNCWVGVTATDETMAKQALHYLDKVKAKVRFISFEPLLDEIVIDFKGRLEWVIIGACTGKHGRQPEKEWTRRIIESASKDNIPVFIKPNLIWDCEMMNFPSVGSLI